MKRSMYYFLALLGILVYSCKDIIEEDIENKTLNILAPANGITSADMTITFWWDEVEGANAYQLQVVKPNFTTVKSLVLDSTVSNNKFSYTFQPGSYEWRLRAVNGSSQTKFVTYAFSIDSTLDLSNQTIVLVSPANNAVISKLTQQFEWQTIPIADDYRFEILGSTGNVVYSNGNNTLNTITYTFTSDGKYSWRVRAQNASSVSPYTTYGLTVDAVPPLAPVLTFPAHGDTVTSPVALKWNRDVGANADSILIATDSLLKAPLDKGYTSNVTYTFSKGTSGTEYFWKVKSRDGAGNWSPYSGIRKFKVN